MSLSRRIEVVLRSLLYWIPVSVLLVAATPTLAEDEGEAPNLREVEERLQRLENELEATRDELRASRTRVDTQQDVLERAGLTEDGSLTALSGLSRFLEQTEFEGWVTASYFWNFNQPRDETGRGENTGNRLLGIEADGLGFPQHPNHNSFQFDQAWFAMSKAATEESRGGYGLDLVFGQTADRLGGDDVKVYQAFVEYLAPLGPGVLVRVGRFASRIGVEPIEALERFNITEGILAYQLQPNTHTGATISSQIGPVRLMVGGANDTLLDPDGDFGDGKTVLFGAGLDISEQIALDVNGAWGDSGVLPGSSLPGFSGRNHVTGKRIGIVDAVVQWDPSERLTTYVDFTYVWTHDPDVAVATPPGATTAAIPGDPRAYGASVGSHYMVDDRTGFGFRGEVLWSEDNLLDPTQSLGRKSDFHIWSLTGTLDHALTDNVGFRVEGRYDTGRTPGGDHVFYRDRGNDGSGTGTPNLRRQQWTAGVEAYYRF